MIAHGTIGRLATPLRTLSAAQVEWVVQQVIAYIGQQRHAYRPGAAPLGMSQKTAMRPFSQSLFSIRLDWLSLWGSGSIIPRFYVELTKMGFEAVSLLDFSLMAAITFVDTVVSHEPFTDRLLFHELVHVVQYEKLGLEEFAAKYVRGFLSGGSYEAIPLERNAYGLDSRFAKMPSSVFSVADEVQRWIQAERF
jgi:hypothetical protein